MNTIFFLFFIAKYVFSTSFYVDCNLGDNNNNGESKKTAWKTLTKINDYVQNFQNGDSIFLKKGCRFSHENLNVSSLKGTENEVSTISSYGKGENPIIDCSLLIEDPFLVVSHNIYSTNIDRVKEITQVIVDDVPYNISHYPTSHNDFLFTSDTTGVAGRLKVRRNDFTFLGDDYHEQINGSRVCVRSNHFSWKCRDVVDVDLTVSSEPELIFAENSLGLKTELRGYKLTNKLWMLEDGEWYFDGNQLYIRMLNGIDPNNVEIRISDIDHGIIMEGNEHFVVENIKVLYPAYSGVIIKKNSQHVVVKNVEVSYSAHTGIDVVPGEIRGEDITDISIEDCQFLDNGIRGINVRNLPYCPPWGEPKRINLVRNRIERTFINFVRVNHQYQQWCIYPISDQHGTSVIHEAEDSVIELNTIINTGYIGIYFAGNNAIIRRNFINNTCLLLDDCGMIYTYAEIWHGNAIISDNVLLNSWGNKYGTSCYLSSCFESPTGFQSLGIYLDNMSTNTTVINNFVFNTETGLFMNKPLRNVMKNNVAVYSKNWGFQTNDYFNANSLGLNATGNIIENNIIHTKKGNILYMGNSEFENVDHCSFINNSILSTYEPETARTVLLLNFLSWENDVYYRHTLELNERDSDSGNVKFPKKWFKSEKFKYEEFGENLILNPTFDTNISGWSEWSHSGGEIIQEWSSDYGGSLKFYKDHPPDNLTFCSLISNSFEIQNGTQYVLKFTGISSESDRLYCFVTNTDFRFTLYFKNELTTFQYVINGTANSTSNFYCYDGNHLNIFHFDNFRLIPARNIKQHYHTQDFDWIFNVETEGRFFELDNKRCDIDGNIIDKRIFLEPREWRFFMKCFCNNDGVCNNYENANSCFEDGCKAICGNGICETITENWINCSEDCLVIEALIASVILIPFFCCIFFVSVLIIVLCSILVRKKNMFKKP